MMETAEAVNLLSPDTVNRLDSGAFLSSRRSPSTMKDPLLRMIPSVRPPLDVQSLLHPSGPRGFQATLLSGSGSSFSMAW